MRDIIPEALQSTAVHVNVEHDDLHGDVKDALAQLAVLCGAMEVFRWIVHAFPSASLSRATFLLCIHSDQLECMPLFGDTSNRLRTSEMAWAIRFTKTDVLDRCLTRKLVRCTKQDMQLAFDRQIRGNHMDVFMANMLTSKWVNCQHEHLEEAASNGNIHMLSTLLGVCRKWRPADIVDALKVSHSAEMLWCRLCMVQRIFNWLKKNKLDVALTGNPLRYRLVCHQRVGHLQVGHLREELQRDQEVSVHLNE